MTTALEPTSRTLDANGLRVHYLDWGNAGAPPMVRVHETLPGGELVRVPGVGHAPTLVEPVVVATLERLLGSTAGRA